MKDSIPVLPDHHSAVRSMVAEAHGEEYLPIETYEKAKTFKDAYVVMEGDWGGQIYLSCPIQKVKCSEKVLQQLLEDLDKIAWDCNDGDGARTYYERHKPGEGLSGGMGGGEAGDHIWLHKEFVEKRLERKIREVLSGKIKSIKD